MVLNPLIPSSTAKTALGVPIAQTLSESMGFSDRSKGAAGLGLAAMVFICFTCFSRFCGRNAYFLLAVILIVLLCVLYWEWLGLIR
ncbi:hypothetical protein [Aneurinibacillus migulanus]|uniref:Uncharacterized protein n=2 Tax=Aneurinibacillus migulanus TaxID=47500 RepID=A0A0D1VWS8_ANEMI|nr:hypothetical protein [Aneurinibacillus migulanus]KIV50700.1 hypothetical protein TS65_29090 [Aneurinibacillus migulanus]KON99375.1 hypothetical protein AF333_01255 [Aneurinibacillus migulanus]MED1615533.1 hypothetical protein [Aneurinibacillus migulanus]